MKSINLANSVKQLTNTFYNEIVMSKPSVFVLLR